VAPRQVDYSCPIAIAGVGQSRDNEGRRCLRRPEWPPPSSGAGWPGRAPRNRAMNRCSARTGLFAVERDDEPRRPNRQPS